MLPCTVILPDLLLLLMFHSTWWLAMSVAVSLHTESKYLKIYSILNILRAPIF